MSEHLHGAGFDLIAISVDDERESVAAFRDELGLTFPILLDPHKDAATAYQTYRFPESFLIGQDGIVVERYVGPKEWAAPAYVTRARAGAGFVELAEALLAARGQ